MITTAQCRRVFSNTKYYSLLYISILCFSSLFFTLSGFAQKTKKNTRTEKEIEYFDEKHIDYTNKVYDPYIQTVIMHSFGSELDLPIITLNTIEKVMLRFDDLNADMREMTYTFEHCTFDWKKSDLLPMDYLQGFNEDIIESYEFSFNTTLSYTHYQIAFPNRNISFSRSGNYIIKVYADGDKENLMLTARFMVVEPLASIDPLVRASSVVEDRDYRQEVDLSVNLGSIQVLNPYSDIELVIMQNFRWDNAKRGVKPSFIKDNKLMYDYQGELTFDGINEFRFFDAKSLRYRSERVLEVSLQDDGYHMILAPDIRRSHLTYVFQNDLNGKFLIKNDDMLNPHIESDYIKVHFTMPVDALLGYGNMFLFGQLTQWKVDKEFRMVYNEEASAYELELLLKQGYYNYMYLWESKTDGPISDFTEGNHSRTENEYVVLVYFKDRSSFADRLIGFKRFSSFNN